MGRGGAAFLPFCPRPAPLRVVKIILANRTKKGESVRCGVMRGKGCGLGGEGRDEMGSIPRSRNQSQIQYLELTNKQPNKSTIFSRTKQIIQKFKQQRNINLWSGEELNVIVEPQLKVLKRVSTNQPMNHARHSPWSLFRKP
jgi:hypothetical protein